MGRFQSELLRIIEENHLDFRFPKWKEIKEIAELGLYPENFFEMLLPEARRDAEWLRDRGIYLYRTPTAEELYAGAEPDIELGNLMEGEKQRFGIRFRDGPKNILILGAAGAGKSVCARNIFLNIDKSNLSHPQNPTLLIVIDPKIDYLDLKQMLHGSVSLFSIHNNLKIGLNGPADVPPNVWIGVISVCIAARIGLIMSRTSLARLISRLLVALNPWLKQEDLNHPHCGKKLIWPSPRTVLEAIKKRGIMKVFAGKVGYGETLIQGLDGLLQDSMKVFECSNGLDLNKDIIQQKKHCILDLSNTPAHVLRLIADILHSQVLVSRLYNKYKCDHTDLYFLADEGDLLVEAEREAAFPDGMSPGSKINRLGREMGIGTIFLVSAPQKIGEHILRNARYTFVFNLSDAQSVFTACRHLQLDPRCQRMLGFLPPGQCLFRQAQAWTNTVWCQVDYVPPARNLGLIEYQPYPYVPAISLSEAPHVLADLNAAVQEFEKLTERQDKGKKSELQQNARRLLQLRAKNPYLPVARLFKIMGIFRFTVQKAIKDDLERRNLAEFEEVRIGRANVLLMDISVKGFEFLGLSPPKENKGRGGIAHRHFAHWIKIYFERKGYQSFIEHIILDTNHPADVAVFCQDKLHVYEVCITSFDNILSHIKACFEDTAAVEHLTIVAATKTNLKEIRSSLEAELIFMRYADRISFEVIEKYLLKEENHEMD